MSNTYSDKHVPLVINRMSKEKFDTLDTSAINADELYILGDNTVLVNKTYIDEILGDINTLLSQV